jgi:death-on-curing protein
MTTKPMALASAGIDPLWLDETLILAIHQRQLAEHGGGDGVRDIGLLQSALAKPQQIFAYTEPAASLTELAAAYAAGIALNHPFVDGNKRTAYVACRMFLKLNGYDFIATQAEKYQIFYDLAAKKITPEELTSWLNQHLVEWKG